MIDFIHLEQKIIRFPREFKLILACLKTGLDKGKYCYHSPLIDPGLDWNLFFDSVLHHGVSPLVYDVLKSSESRQVPAKILSRLQLLFKKNYLDSMNLAAELSYLIKLFDACDIRVISLKGPALAKRIYRDPFLRTSSDLDLLASPDDMEAIERILFKNGYNVLRRPPKLTRKEQAFFRQSTHHYTYCHNETNIPIEIHWRLSKHTTGFFSETHFDNLWEKRETITVNETRIPTLSAIDNCLYLMIHGAYHQWLHLRWIYDIAVLLECHPGITVDSLMNYAGKFELQAVVGQAVILSRLLFGTCSSNDLTASPHMDKSLYLCEMVLAALPANLNPGKMKPFSSELYRHILYILMLLSSNKNRLRFILNHLRPTLIDYQTIHLPDRYFPLYYFLRPFLLLARQLKS